MSQCYIVMWCNYSNKKRKVLNDGELTASKGNITLYDDNKKILCSCFRKNPLVIGEILLIGGKEVEIMEIKGKPMPSDSLLSSSIDERETKFNSNKMIGDFKPPKAYEDNYTLSSSKYSQSNSIKFSLTFEYQLAKLYKKIDKPLHSNLFCLPYPPAQHQWLVNTLFLPITPVYIDSFLTHVLRPHQLYGVEFLYECVMGYKELHQCGCILADEMGLGKTLLCITLIWVLYTKGPYGNRPVIKRCLVLCPGSLVKNWENEFSKWLGLRRLKVFAVHGKHSVDELMKYQNHAVLILSYEMFLRNANTLSNLFIDLIICDEGHRLKNFGNKTRIWINSLNSQRKVLLTGTPLQNDFQEFYALLQFTNPDLLGNQVEFKLKFESPILAAKQPHSELEKVQAGHIATEQLAILTKPYFLRRTQDSVKHYLPTKSEFVIFCKPTTYQIQLYQALLSLPTIKNLSSHNFESKPDEQSNYSARNNDHLSILHILSKLCNFPSSLINSNLESKIPGMNEVISRFSSILCSPHMELSGKVKVLFYLLECFISHGMRVIVVSSFTQTLDRIQALCRNKEYFYLRLDGKVSTDKRQTIVDQFNNPFDPHMIFLLSTKAGGMGINLVGASRLILFDSNWNPAHDMQAMARIWREGQTKPVKIYRLLTTGTIEEKIFQRQVLKQGLASTLLIDQSSIQEFCFEKNDVVKLFTLNVDTLCDTHDILKCKCLNKDEGYQIDEESTDFSSGSSRMDELLQWQHFTSEAGGLETVEDEFIPSMKDYITFVFLNKFINF